VVRAGEVQSDECAPLEEIVARARTNLERLPERYRVPTGGEPYPVRMSNAIQALRRTALARFGPYQADRSSA
jgi:hypothetical protein